MAWQAQHFCCCWLTCRRTKPPSKRQHQPLRPRSRPLIQRPARTECQCDPETRSDPMSAQDPTCRLSVPRSVALDPGARTCRSDARFSRVASSSGHCEAARTDACKRTGIESLSSALLKAQAFTTFPGSITITTDLIGHACLSLAPQRTATQERLCTRPPMRTRHQARPTPPTVTSASPAPFVSPRGLFDKTQRFPHRLHTASAGRVSVGRDLLRCDAALVERQRLVVAPKLLQQRDQIVERC